MQLKILRKRKLLTQTDLAKLLGCSTTCISYWENGKTCPKFKTINKLAEILNETPEAIVKCFTEQNTQN